MFCIKCGNQLNENDKFCEFCGAKAEALPESDKEHIEEATVVSECQTDSSNTAVEPTSEVVTDSSNTAVEPIAETPTEEAPLKPEKVKKHMPKRKKILIGSIATAVVAAVAVCAVFTWDYIENFAVKTFSSSEGYYRYVESKNIDELALSVGSVVGNIGGDKQNNYSSTTDVRVQLGDVLVDYIAKQGGIDKSQLTWASDIGMKFDLAMVGNVISYGDDLALGENSVICANYIYDYDNMRIYMCIPQLKEQYLVLDMSAMSVDTTTYTMLRDVIAQLPDEEMTEKIINRYLTVAVGAVSDVEEKSTVVKANGVSQKCTQLTVTVDEDAVQDIVKAVLEEFKNDKEVKNIIKNIAVSTGEIDKDEFNDEYDMMLDSVDEMLDSVDEIEMPESFKIITYVDRKGDVIGRKIKNSNSDTVVYYLSTRNGNDVGFELTVGFDSEFKVIGSGSVDGDKLNAEYNVFVTGVKMLNLNVKSFDLLSFEDGHINGTFTASLPREICSLLREEGEISDELCKALSNMTLEAVITSDEKSSSFAMTLKHKNDILVSVSATGTYAEPTDIVIPDNAIAMDDIDDLADYLNSIDIEVLFDSLIKAGMPQELVDQLKESLGAANDPSIPDYDYDYDYGFGYDGEGGIPSDGWMY